MTKLVKVYLQSEDGYPVVNHIEYEVLVKLDMIFRDMDKASQDEKDCIKEDIHEVLKSVVPQAFDESEYGEMLEYALTAAIYNPNTTPQYQLGGVIEFLDRDAGYCVHGLCDGDSDRVAFGRSIDQARQSYFHVVGDGEVIWD